jgi:3-isopropylmalate dehydrogenase
MILSAAMMLDWLGRRHGASALVADGARLQRAVEEIVAEGQVLTADMGGTASTMQAADAIRTRALSL